MPLLKDIISEENKKKLLMAKDKKPINYIGDKDHPIKEKSVKNNFIGQTPNLNSSLGVNAADGTTTPATTTPAPAPTTSKLGSILAGAGTFINNSGIIPQLLGGGNSSSGSGYTPPPAPAPSSKILGIPSAIFWIILVILIIIIGVIVIKKMRKK
jgi:hypothetical protein